MACRKRGRLGLDPVKYFRCGSEDHLIAKFTKPPKENEKRGHQVRFSERGNNSFQK